MPELDLHRAMSFATALAREGGRMALRERSGATVQRKPDGTEVTSADLAIQAVIVKAIASEYPDCGVVAEEVQDHPGAPLHDGPRYVWVIDPLDGTRNYVRGFPCHATSIALLDEGLPVVGVIHEHNTGVMFAAIQSGEPLCENRAIKVADRPFSRGSLVAVPSGRNERTGPVVRAWLDEVVLRNMGSTAMHLALVARGALDAAYCRECHLWDIAAGWLLVTAAGGRCTDLRGEPLFPMNLPQIGRGQTPFLAGSSATHEVLLRSLRDPNHALPSGV